MRSAFRRPLVAVPLLLMVMVAAGGQFTAARAASTAPQVRVSGTHLVDGSGNVLQLRGVDRSGTEYACIGGWGIFDGPSDAASVAAMASWSTNAVRVPLNEDCWLGINGVKAQYSGSTYRTAIQDYVSTLHSQGLVAILDLHWSAPGTARAKGQRPMPDADHSPAFWTSVAQTFAGDLSTVFDLFNEPYPGKGRDSAADWTCWQSGGRCAGVSYSTAGMQRLVSTVRATGATNVVMVGGLDWSNDLSGWARYAPTDPLHQMAASFHMYPSPYGCVDTSCWNAQVAPVAATVPVITGEFGPDYSNCSTTVTLAFLQWADQHGISYLAWTWDDWQQCEVLITDYSGTPTAFGQVVKSHLQGTGP